MNIKIQFIALFLVFVFSKTAQTQNDYQLGVLPVININKKLTNNLKLNFKTESRQIIYKENNFDLRSELVDFSTIISKKVGFNNSLASGYLLRIRNNNIIHRLIQQFTIIQNKSILRIGHRFTSDQTFEKESTTFRLRYRISGQIPLSGESVNSKEFYLKANNEYLNALESRHYDLEIRLAIILGYEFNDNNKLEFGLENRFGGFIDQTLKNKSWINIGWFIAL